VSVACRLFVMVRYQSISAQQAAVCGSAPVLPFVAASAPLDPPRIYLAACLRFAGGLRTTLHYRLCELSSLLTVKTLTGMTTDVYPRENCIAPAIVLIVWTTDTKNGSGLAPDCVP